VRFLQSVSQHVVPEELRYYIAHPLSIEDATVKGTIMVYLVLSAVFHFGSLCFEKNAFVKTSLYVLVIVAILFYLNFYSMKAMIPGESMPGGKFYNEGLRLGSSDDIKGLIELPGKWNSFIYWFLPGMLYMLFWMGSYFKLKEKQV